MSDAHAVRRDRLLEHCSAAGMDAALITSPANVRYLTGCTPCGASLLVTRERALLALPADLPPEDNGEFVYPVDLPLQSAAADQDTAELAAMAAAGDRVGELAVEEHDLTVRRYREVADRARGAAARPGPHRGAAAGGQGRAGDRRPADRRRDR